MVGSLGKFVAHRRYFHVSLIDALDADIAALVGQAATMAGAQRDSDFNVVRIDASDDSIALLDYPTFFDEACPALSRSWKVIVGGHRVTLRRYDESFNPPVLHRKELLLHMDDPRRAMYEQLTGELEAIGCFQDPVRIGFKLQWDRLVRERGFRIVGHQLVPIGNEVPVDEGLHAGGPIEIARHLTALSRHNFSAPLQLLRRFGYLDGSRTVFDYGCGKGDDLRGLLDNGLQASGWDPYFAPAGEIAPACIVNLGFVINVIEDPVERRDALLRAFSLADELLVVSAMVATDNPGQAKLYGDGVLTSRATFQKYYAQAELRDYLRSTLKEDPVSVAPGVFFVFKDKNAEQRFQVSRQRGRIRIHSLARPRRDGSADRQDRRRGRDALYLTHKPLLAELWERCLQLGREPDPTEVSDLGAVEQALGSLKKALRITVAHHDRADLEQASRQRGDDLKVFLALEQFQRRKPYRTLEAGLQRDIRAFFGDYTSAQEHAKHLLFEVAKPELLDECCRVASEQGLGWFEPSHSLQLHSSLVPRLPAPLRVYVGCAAVLYGEVTESDVVKIHIRSGKASFMKYDDFLGKAIPLMTQRVKINLRTLDFELYAYGGEYPCPPLYLKSRFMNEELPSYAEQLAFDEALQTLDVDLSGYGPSHADFSDSLKGGRWQVNGFILERAHCVPHIDEPCGRFFTYRQLVECGETQATTKISNHPKRPESYTALFELATAIIDPVVDYFGSIELTYGFCSSELGRHIHRRIAPALDQHAAHELNRNRQPICARLGAAVDFLVRDENMLEVAEWIRNNLDFDRLYVYASDRPLHVSYGPAKAKQCFRMLTTKQGSLIPRPFRGPDVA